MSYLDGQPIIQSVFHGIPISSCSTFRQIQTTPCYDIIAFTATRCTTIESDVAAAAINLTQCTATVETATQARFWGSTGGRDAFTSVRRISARLLTYVTGEPIYAPTPGARMTAIPTDLPLSEARIAALPGSTWDDSHGLPVATQAASTANIAAATSEDDNTAAHSSVLGRVLLDSGLLVSQDGSSATITKYHVGSLALPTPSPQLEHVDVLKMTLDVGKVNSEPQSAPFTPQAIDPQARKPQLDDLKLTNIENAKDDTKDVPLFKDTQGTYGEMLPSEESASKPSNLLSQESDHGSPMDSGAIVSADDGLKPLASENVPAATPVSTSSINMQTQTLAPGSMLSFGSVHLSAVPDPSGLALSNGSTLRLKDGDTAEIKLPNGPTLQVSRSGAVYLVATRTARTTPQLTGTSDPAKTPEQTAGDGFSFLGTISEASSDLAAGGPTDPIAGEVSTGGAALVCPSDVRELLAGMLLLMLICLINRVV